MPYPHFKGCNERRGKKAPVTIQTGESDAVIKVYKNGAVSSDTYTLTTGGNYRIKCQ